MVERGAAAFLVITSAPLCSGFLVVVKKVPLLVVLLLLGSLLLLNVGQRISTTVERVLNARCLPLPWVQKSSGSSRPAPARTGSGACAGAAACAARFAALALPALDAASRVAVMD